MYPSDVESNWAEQVCIIVRQPDLHVERCRPGQFVVIWWQRNWLYNTERAPLHVISEKLDDEQSFLIAVEAMLFRSVLSVL